MSDDLPKEGASTIGASPLTIIVKGGTTSSALDKTRAQQTARAEAGREHQEKQERAAKFGAGMTPGGFVHSSLTSMRMMDNGSPRVVFFYLNKDKTVRQECVGEIVMLPDGDEVVTLVCPRCLESGEVHGSAQVMIKKSHRKFYLDTRTPAQGGKAGTLVQLVDPDRKPFHVRVCGTVFVDDIIRCSNVGCQWAVRISDSKVEEA
jgi:hypothetical protein